MKNEKRDIREELQHGYRFALALTHERVHAEDLVHEVVLRFARSERPPTRWMIFRAIKNLFIDELRKSRTGPELVPLDENVVKSARARDAAERDEPLHLSNGALTHALAEIRPEERGVVYLSAVEEMSAQAIADLLKWPRSTVLSLLQRGRVKLRNTLERHLDR